MSHPQLSVVVPSVNGLSDLIDCLEALEVQRDDLELEVLVADRVGDDLRREIERRFYWVQVVDAEPGTTIPELRAAAFEKARGDAVAVIEDHVIVPPGWGRQLLDALGEERSVVGGSVENAATDTLMDQAAFLCEYSHCIPPIEAGSVGWLTGNNVVYRRELLDRYRAVVEEGKWENRLHDALRGDGIDLVCHPEIVVGHKKHYTFGEYMSQRYLYARSYAGARVKGAPLVKRLAFGAAAFLLPPILLWRIVGRIWSKGHRRGLLVKSLPLIGLFVCSWAWGEVVGYWFGAGDSLSRVC